MDASFTKVEGRYRLSLERSLAHPPEKVWRALTERDLLKQWFPCDVEGKWEPGAELRFAFLWGEFEGLTEEDMRGEVFTVEPPQLLEFRWGSSWFRCEVVAEGNGSRLLFSETLDEPSWGARNAAGWEACFDNLELILQGATAVQFAMKTWRPVFERYVKKFQPEFGPQEGPPEDHPGVQAEHEGS